MVFFTICSKNFFAYAHTLYDSLREQYPDMTFFVALCDELDGSIDLAQEPFEIIELDRLGIPDLQEMAHRYNITEFNTAIKPFVFRYLFSERGFSSVIYFDPDILVIDRLVEVEHLLADGAEAILTPHILAPAENVEVHDQKMLMFGIYNLGFLALRNTEQVRKIVDWWTRRLMYHCVIKLEVGLFTDQKWVDLFPAFISGTKILHHPGYNVAYWNLSQRQVKILDGKWTVNSQALKFVHFSGHRLEDPLLFSRHCSEHTLNNIGELRLLVDEYRNKVAANNHEAYRQLPYAFSWNGHAGVNLHTPEPIAGAQISKLNSGEVGGEGFLQSQLSRVRTFVRALPVAYKMSGGILSLLTRLWGAYRMYGIDYVKAQIVELSRFSSSPQPKLPERDGNISSLEGRGKAVDSRPTVLYVDWNVPMPDQDAASVTAICLLEIFLQMGYRITYLPVSLRYEPSYTEALIKKGIECVHYPDVTSVGMYLKQNASRFSLFVLCRGPVVGPLWNIIREAAPDGKLIFNTVDLHYLREQRQAELEKSAVGLEKAEVTKRMELDLIRHTNLTIVLSSEELYTVRAEIPEAPLLVLPLIFSDIPGCRKPFTSRQDLVFIGGFTHPPNVDAVLYFVQEIFPLVRSRLSDISFHIIGSYPPDDVLALAQQDGVVVHGFVQELDDIFDSIKLSVAPLRYGAGIKGKIGTSLTYGVPCVATPIAVEGMGLRDREDVLVGDSPERFAEAILEAYSDALLWNRLSEAGLAFVYNNYSLDVAVKRLGNAVNSLMHGIRPVEATYEIESFDAYRIHSARLDNEYKRRRALEISLLPRDDSSFLTAGYCVMCGCQTDFITSFMYAYEQAPDGRLLPNWREHMACNHCGKVNRIRAAMHLLHQIASPATDDRIYITEQVTPLYEWLKKLYPFTQGSEYLGSTVEPGILQNGIRNEDVTRLSFEADSFNYLLTFDVLEHVPDYLCALKEVFRCLKPGGLLFIGVPFLLDSPVNVIRASLAEGGKIIHHLPPEYHGNPVDEEGGALCYQYFGWEFLDQMRKVGFQRVRMVVYWSLNYGYLGKEQMLLVAEKPS